MNFLETILILLSVASVVVYIVISSLAAIAYYGSSSTASPKDRFYFGKFFGYSVLLLCLSILCVILHTKGYNVLGINSSMLLLNSLILIIPFLGLFCWSKLGLRDFGSRIA